MCSNLKLGRKISVFFVLGLVLSLLSLLAFPVKALDVSSPILNTGFEDGSTGWTLYSFSVDDSVSYNLNKSVKCEASAGGWIEQSVVPAIPAYKFMYYNFSVMFHDQTVYGSEGDEQIYIKLWFSNGSNTGAMNVYTLDSYVVDTWIVVSGNFLDLEDIYGDFERYASDASIYVSKVTIGYQSGSNPPYMYCWIDSTGYDGDYDGEGGADDGLIYIDNDALPYDYNEGDGEGGTSSYYNELYDYIVVFLVVYFPAIVCAGVGASVKNGGLILPLFVCGLFLGTVAGAVSAIVPFWVLFSNVLLLLFVMFIAIKKGI